MIPSSLLGLLLFIALLAPGLAYVLRHERVIPAPQQSAFRETVRVVFVSVVCLTTVGLLFTLLRWLLPDRTPNIRGLVRDPAAFTRDHHVHLAWWALALLVSATLLGAVLADPRVIRKARALGSRKWPRRLFGESRIGDFSAWNEALNELRQPVPAKSGEKHLTYVGAQMSDGTYIHGYLVSFNPQVTENDQRELILTRAKIRTADGVEADIGSTLTILSARHITRLDVTHMESGSTASLDDVEEAPTNTLVVQQHDVADETMAGLAETLEQREFHP